MADRKISELSNMNGTDLNDADEFVVVDTSADETKAITYKQLRIGLADENQGLGGSGNVALGSGALDSIDDADPNNVTANYNTAVGEAALTALTTGDNNVAVGRSALETVATGSANVAVGKDALKLSTTSDNTAVGYEALEDQTTGYARQVRGSRRVDSIPQTPNLYRQKINSTQRPARKNLGIRL